MDDGFCRTRRGNSSSESGVLEQGNKKIMQIVTLKNEDWIPLLYSEPPPNDEAPDPAKMATLPWKLISTTCIFIFFCLYSLGSYLNPMEIVKRVALWYTW